MFLATQTFSMSSFSLSRTHLYQLEAKMSPPPLPGMMKTRRGQDIQISLQKTSKRNAHAVHRCSLFLIVNEKRKTKKRKSKCINTIFPIYLYKYLTDTCASRHAAGSSSCCVKTRTRIVMGRIKIDRLLTQTLLTFAIQMCCPRGKAFNNMAFYAVMFGWGG